MCRPAIFCAALLLLLAPGTANAEETPSVTIAVLPAGTTVAEVASVEGMSPGIFSAGLGKVPAKQTWLDISQGSRVSESLYSGDLPSFRRSRLQIEKWDEIEQRAASAPADLVPGLLGETAGLSAVSSSIGSAAVIAARRDGRVSVCARCGIPLTVRPAAVGGLSAITARLRGDDLLIAIAAPPPEGGKEPAIGIAGRGFGEGNLTSDTTRTDGYIAATDIAPTVLDRLIGYRLDDPVPDQMTGRVIRADGDMDPEAVVSFADRISVITVRRDTVLGLSLVIWALVAGLAALIGGPRAASFAARSLALSVVYVPLLLLFTAALRPSEAVEWIVFGLGCPLIAVLTVAALRGHRAFAVAAALTLGACFLDVVLGSPLTKVSLIGPNPASGGRFFGIGNWLEATLVVLTLAGTGAALRAWRPGIEPARAVGAFVLAGILAVLVLAPGRFGADVGAAIILPIGVAVAAAVLLGDRRLLALVVIAPVVALLALGLIDLLSGGDSHLTSSVLGGSSAEGLGDVAERRLRLAGQSFTRGAGTFLLPFTLAVLAAGFYFRRRIGAELWSDPILRAAFLGSVAAILVGAVANDTGVVVLQIGAAYIVALVVFTWAVALDATCASHSSRHIPGPTRGA